jgi:hypothetical protein
VKTWPNFFIVGAARAGTSSLDRYLSQHPVIYIAPRKDTHFFAAESFPCRFNGPGDERLSRLLIRDEDQYNKLFAEAPESMVVGESSAFYLHMPGTAERIVQTVPDAKIIIILREPLDRAYSAYTLMVRDGRETLEFEEGLRREEERKQKGFEPIWWYKELSLYYAQVKHFQEVFGTQQVKVLLYDELFTNLERALRDIFIFLGVKEDVIIDTSVRYNVSGVPKSRRFYNVLDNFIYNPNNLQQRIKSLVPAHMRTAWASKLIGMSVKRVSLQPQQQTAFKAYFTEDVRKLENLVDRDLSNWGYSE